MEASTNNLQRAHYAQVIGEFDTAVQAYTEYLAQSGDSYEALIGKASALQRLHNFAAAQKDAESAIGLDGARWEGYFYRAQSQFLLAQYRGALTDFQAALSKAQDGNTKKRIETQVSKCKCELEATEGGAREAAAASEAPAAATTSAAPAVAAATASAAATNAAPATAPAASTTPVAPKKITYTWYQTLQKVGIEINFTLTQSDQLKCQFGERKLDLSFPIEAGRDYQMNIDLFDEIVPEKSKATVGLYKIDIVMEKKNRDKNWARLDAPNDAAASENAQETSAPKQQNGDAQGSSAPAVVVEEQRPFYPSSSKAKKDWSKIDHEIEEDMKKNREEYGLDPLNSLFQQIYQNADENTRRAMIKSFQTSGGTVLSTNWDEVKEKDYEGKDRPEPPKGQSWQKWEK